MRVGWENFFLFVLFSKENDQLFIIKEIWKVMMGDQRVRGSRGGVSRCLSADTKVSVFIRRGYLIFEPQHFMVLFHLNCRTSKNNVELFDQNSY